VKSHQQRDYLTQRLSADILLRAIVTRSSVKMLLDSDGELPGDDLEPSNARRLAFDHAAFLDHVS
jgi:hypothetical protein